MSKIKLYEEDEDNYWGGKPVGHGNDVLGFIFAIIVVTVFVLTSFYCGRAYEQTQAVKAHVAQFRNTPNGIIFEYIKFN